MPPRLSWSKLIPGIIALSVLALVAVGVVMFGGVGKVRGDTVRFYVLADQARGLMKGSEVWLDGQRAGVVDHVGFRAPSADTLHRVVIAVDVRSDAAERLRQDSRIRVRSGGTIVGPVVVFLESGTPGGATVRSGDTLRALAQADVATLVQDLGAATDQFPALMADARVVLSRARNPDETIGALLTHGVPLGEIRKLRENIGALRAGLGGGKGPRLAVLRERAASAVARADSIQALLASPASSLGRFRRDSTLLRNIGEIAGELATLQSEIADSPGTLSRWQNDSAIERAIADARSEMALLFADVKRRPLRYIHF